MFGFLVLSGSWASASDPNLSPPELSCELAQKDGIHLSEDGVVDLKWGHLASNSKGATYELQARKRGAEFVTRYVGTDQSSVLTGLAEGVHEFRVGWHMAEGETSTWSEPLILKVQYMDAAKVRWLLILGGLVVVATVIAILHGHFTHRGKEGRA